jgi:general secretion pathway protein I
LAQAGFTLVEVLVALAIVAITLGAGLRASGSQIASAERQSDLLVAQLCAENELIKVRLLRQLPNIGDIRFTCEQAGQTYEGQLVVQGTPNPSFRKVEAVVFKTAVSGDGAVDPQRSTVLLRLTTLAGRF